MAASAPTGRANAPAAMTPMCCVCHEFLTEAPTENGATGDIVAITCGHVYHKHCINRWFTENVTGGPGISKPCPVCNKKVLLRSARKIYLQFGEAREEPQEELQNLREALTVSENSRAELVAQNEALKAKVASLESAPKTTKGRPKGGAKKEEKNSQPRNKRPCLDADVITLD